MEKVLKKYLELFDYPFRKAVIDTFFGVLFCLLAPALIIISALAREKLGLPWSFNFNWDFWGLNWLKSFLEWFVSFFVNSVLTYFELFLLSMMGAVFVYFYITGRTIKSFIALFLFKRITTPLLISYFIFIVVDKLIRIDTFSDSTFLDNNWSPLHASTDGITFFYALIFTWFLTAYAINKQSNIHLKKDIESGNITFTTRLNDLRQEYIKRG